jgi:two-component system NtrC family sensor kinase
MPEFFRARPEEILRYVARNRVIHGARHMARTLPLNRGTMTRPALAATGRSGLPAARLLSLGAWMLLALGSVTGFAWWDSRRESEAILRDVAREQSALAAVLAVDLRAHLAALESGGRVIDASVGAAALLGTDDGANAPREPTVPAELCVFLSPPGEASLLANDGRTLSAASSGEGFAAIREALDDGAPTLRLSRSGAASVGLAPRTAMAGLAHVDGGAFGRWGVVAVESAARPRDREARSFWRLVLAVGFAAVWVLAFGGMALRQQRKELELARELAVAHVERERDEHLGRAERVATMGTFAMGIVHEVATPLGVIVGRAEQLRARIPETDERSGNAAQAIMRQVDRIQLVTRRFLDMARGGPPSLARTDPADIIRAAAALVEHRFAKAGVSLAVRAPHHAPEIRCDRALLEQAIVNLLLNACDACTTGGHVELVASVDAERVAFVVIDDGVGITPEDAARATRPFFTTKAAGLGTGLGLAIASEIAKSHRGELTLAPRGPNGTRACIEIPVAAADAPGRPIASAAVD